MESKTARRATQVNQTHPKPTGMVSGFSAQSIILTMQGECTANSLELGERIITRDSGTAVLTSLTRKICKVAMVAIKSGSLGHRRPPEDVLIAPDSRILIRDWRAQALRQTPQALICARDLIDGEFIRFNPEQTVEVIELGFDQPHILYAGGLEVACQSPS